MNLNTQYGDRFVFRFTSEDGYLYRISLARAGYDGPVRDVAGDGCTVAWSGVSGDALAALSPVAASEMRLRLVDTDGGLTGEIEGSPDGAWRSTLHRCARADGEPDAADALEWMGYLYAARRDEAEILPGVTGTTLSFLDGLGMLRRAFAGPGSATPTAAGVTMAYDDTYEPLLGSVLRVLGPLGGGDRTPGVGAPLATWAEVRTAVQWFARVETAWAAGGYTQTPATSDPLAYLCTQAAAWLTSNGETVGAGDALRTILHRVSARLYQSGGVWRVDQPALLARNAEAVPVHVYPATNGAGGSVAFDSAPGPGQAYAVPTTEEDWGFNPSPSPAVTEARTVDLHDTPGLFVQIGDARGSALPLRTVESTYAHGALGDLLVNGSFERARAGSPYTGSVETQPDGWTVTGGARRFLITDSEWLDFDVTAGDVYALLLPRTSGGLESAAVQRIPFTLPASRDWTFQVEGSIFGPEIGSRATNGLVKLRATRPDGTVCATQIAKITVNAGALPGKGVAVIASVQVDVLGASPIANGVAIFPEGSTFYFGRTAGSTTPEYNPRGTLTLTRPFVTGDAMMRGDLSLAGSETSGLLAGDVAPAVVWVPGEGDYSLGNMPRAVGPTAPIALAMLLGSVATDGRAVEGAVDVMLHGAKSGGTPNAFVDDVAVTLNIVSPTSRTAEARATTGRASKPAGSTGTDGALPIAGAVSGGFPIGDGPLPGSDGGMLVTASRDGVTLDPVPTVAASDWRAVAHAATPDGPGVGLEAHAAREALALAGWSDAATGAAGPLLTMRTVSQMHASPGVPAFRLRPHHVRRVWVPSALVYSATAGTSEIVLTRPARPGGMVRLADDAAGLTVDTVAGGAGGFAVTLTATVPASMPAGSRVWVSVLAWWTASQWDVYAGTVADDLTELGRDASPVLIQTALSA